MSMNSLSYGTVADKLVGQQEKLAGLHDELNRVVQDPNPPDDGRDRGQEYQQGLLEPLIAQFQEALTSLVQLKGEMASNPAGYRSLCGDDADDDAYSGCAQYLGCEAAEGGTEPSPAAYASLACDAEPYAAAYRSLSVA